MRSWVVTSSLVSVLCGCSGTGQDEGVEEFTGMAQEAVHTAPQPLPECTENGGRNAETGEWIPACHQLCDFDCPWGATGWVCEWSGPSVCCVDCHPAQQDPALKYCRVNSDCLPGYVCQSVYVGKPTTGSKLSPEYEPEDPPLTYNRICVRSTGSPAPQPAGSGYCSPWPSCAN
jgi:hypothetical protein